MKELVAKSIVNDSYYIVIDGNNKVGNVLVKDNGVFLTVNKKTTHYSTTNELSENEHIKFSYTPRSNKTETLITYPTSTKSIFNQLYDSKLKLQIYTETEDSKSFKCAGYFLVKMLDDFEVMFCPKYIYLTRYEFIGPFQTKELAENYVKNTS